MFVVVLARSFCAGGIPRSLLLLFFLAAATAERCAPPCRVIHLCHPPSLLEIYLPAPPQIKRAITIPATIRSHKGSCGKIECQVRVTCAPGQDFKICNCKQGLQGVPSLDAVFAEELRARLACRCGDLRTAHFGPESRAPVVVAECRLHQKRRRRHHPPGFLETSI